MSQTQRLTGVVRKVLDGYGFIAGNDGVDYFAHWTAFRTGHPTLRETKEGDRVSFEPYTAPKGPRAIEIEVSCPN